MFDCVRGPTSLVGPAKSRTQLFGYSLVVWHGVRFLRHRGRFPWWRGSSDPSVPRSPRVSPKRGRAAHGPRHPAMNVPLGLCRGLCQFVVMLFRSFFALMIRLFFLTGWYVVGCFALQAPTRVWITICVLLFTSLCLVCSPTPFLSLSLSSSQALGKPKPLWFGFPLVFRGHNLSLPPVPRGRHLHQGLRPACVFL